MFNTRKGRCQFQFENERDHSVDFLSGFLVIYMIYTHICQEIPLQVDSSLYVFLDSLLFFFMPWFFFKSGMFYKHGSPTKKTIKKTINRLVLPLVVFSVANIPIYILTVASHWTDGPVVLFFAKAFLGDLLYEGSPFGNAPLWFLIALIIIRFFILSINKVKWFIPLSILFVLISFFLWDIHIRPIRLLMPSLLGFSFYVFGYYLKNLQYDKIVLCSSIVLFILFFFLFPYHISVRSNEIYKNGLVNMYGGGYFMSIIFSLAGIIIINNIAKTLFRWNWIRRSFLCHSLCVVGEDSMYYYVIHWIYLKAWSKALVFCGVDIHFLFLILPMTLFLSKKLHVLDKYTGVPFPSPGSNRKL